MLGCHKPVVPVAIFLTPLAWNSQVPKDRWATLSRSVFILKIKIMWAFALLLSARFPFSLSSPEDTCVTLWQMYRPSQTPRLTRSSERIARRPKPAALKASSNKELEPWPESRFSLYWISKKTMRAICEPRKFRRIFYNFCFLFWGQACGNTKTCIMVTIFCFLKVCMSLNSVTVYTDLLLLRHP